MQRIGFIGLGLMGHGMAKNLLRKGHPLSFLVHRNRSNLAELLDLGGKEAASPKELMAQSDVVILCVTGTPQVEANVYGGACSRVRGKGQIVIDTSTAEPASTERIRADFAKERRALRRRAARAYAAARRRRQAQLHGRRRPADLRRGEAGAGKVLREHLPRRRPGHGHKIKLVYNFVAMAHAAICLRVARRVRQRRYFLESFFQLVSAGGANSNMFQMLVPKALKGDLTGLMFTLGNAKKDIDYYQRMVAGARSQVPWEPRSTRRWCRRTRSASARSSSRL